MFTGTAYVNEIGERSAYTLRPPDRISFEDLLLHNPITCSSVLIKKELLKNDVAIHDGMHEDYAMWLSILRDEPYAYAVPRPLTVHRMASGSKSSNKIQAARMNYRTLRHVGVGWLAAFPRWCNMRQEIFANTQLYIRALFKKATNHEDCIRESSIQIRIWKVLAGISEPTIGHSGVLYYPLWMIYSAAFLEDQGFDISFYDACAKPLSKEETFELIGAAEDYVDLFVINTSTPSIYSDVSFAQELKEKYPDSFVLLVGTHPSSLPEETLGISQSIDGVARKEYDAVVLELAKALDARGRRSHREGTFVSGFGWKYYP